MGDGTLLVRDSRTNLEYTIPIVRNSVAASEFKKFKNLTDGPQFAKAGRGLQVFDPGLENTAIKESHISSRDPKTGLPVYRGYTVDDLWTSDFEDLFHLMVFEKYPSPTERESLRKALEQEMMNVPGVVVDTIRSFPPTSPPMFMILAGLSAFAASDTQAIPAMRGKNLYHNNIELVNQAAVRTAAAYAVVLGLAASHRKGISFTPAKRGQTFYENLFTMMGHVDQKTRRPDPVVLSCFRRAAILNADNGMTQSTFVMLAAASSLPDPISCLISAVSAAYGPLHYGAQEASYNNLKEIGDEENVPKFLEQVKKGERRLYGYGHRSLAAEDARLAPVKAMLNELGVSTTTYPLLRIAQEIDRVASKDEYFQKRKLCANADFYTLFLFSGMKFEPDMITVANLSQRLLGLIAHWREAMSQKIKLFRPLHIYVEPRSSNSHKEVCEPTARL